MKSNVIGPLTANVFGKVIRKKDKPVYEYLILGTGKLGFNRLG